MGKYAATTEVPVERTRAEIEATVRKYGADGFVSGWEGNRSMVQFRAACRYVRFLVELPDRNAPEFNTYKQGSKVWRRADGVAEKLWEQACRQRWRALALMIKAKLEAVESGIVTFEQEFLPHVMLPDGTTVYERTREQVRVAYESGSMPALLPDLSGRGTQG